MRALIGLISMSLVIITSSPFAAAAPPREPYFGRVGERCAAPETTPGKGMIRPGVARPSPPAADEQALVQAFVRASVEEDRAGLEQTAATAWLSSDVAESCISAIRTISESCQAEPLYLLGDGEIRLAWACGNMVPYQVYFTVTEGKISNVWATEATSPVTVAPVRTPSQ